MSEKLAKPPRRGRRTVVFASLAAVAAMLVASVGTAPAQVPENGVGGASARGTDPDAHFGLGATTTAQFSAITNCDAAQNTRPFYVRWIENGTSHVFKRTKTTSSSCSNGANFPLANFNQGVGEGIIDGLLPAGVLWGFQDSPDSASIEIAPSVSALSLDIGADPPAALNGTPGGVWVFGTLPWPAAPFPQ